MRKDDEEGACQRYSQHAQMAEHERDEHERPRRIMGAYCASNFLTPYCATVVTFLKPVKKVLADVTENSYNIQTVSVVPFKINLKTVFIRHMSAGSSLG